MLTPERIDLHMPVSWNAMTTEELETIASVMLNEAERVTERRPFNTEAVKVKLFFELSELEVIKAENPKKAVEEQYYVVRCGKSDPFNIYLWQIHYWMKNEMKWIDGPSLLTRFPYPTIRKRFRTFQGPSTLMQNFSWAQYRIAGDYMSYYISQENQLLHMTKSGGYSDRDIRKQVKAVDLARAMFLATIFDRKVKFVDEQTHRMVKDYRYLSNQHIDNLKYFRGFPKYKFQVILFWWTGMMNYLKSKYPKCFKKESTKKQAQVNPLELYTRTTATMEKYLGLNEEELSKELFTVMLQHINDMVTESERMEAMNRKK